MSEAYITNIALSLQQYPYLLLLCVFLISFTESLIIIGLIVPGAILMLLFGAMIALNVLSFWPTVMLACLGAIAGDTLSYWLGGRYQDKLNAIWPLSRHPELIVRANAFFSKHGTKSIIFSRFIGPLRPVIPAIAGMTGMKKKIFLSANIASAIVWAPLYLLPGILFGLSLDIASEFSSKFIFIVVILFFGIVISLWSLRRIYNFIKPHSENFIATLLNWSKRHPLAGEMPSAIFDASHPEVKGLSLLALIIFTAALFLFIIHQVFTLPFSFDSINRLVFYSLQSFRSPPFDSLMLWAGNVTRSNFIAIVALCGGALLIYKNKLPALWHLLAAVFLPLLLSFFLQNNLTDILRLNLNIDFQSLPSMVLVSFIGFSTILFSSGFPSHLQKLVYYFSASFVLLLSLAQIYLSLQLFSQVLLGLTISAVWISFLGIAYRRHIQAKEKLNYKKIFAIVFILLLYPSWATITQQRALHKPVESDMIMGGNSWLESGWEVLPVYRQDIFSNTTSAFNLQWAGSGDNIRQILQTAGFIPSVNPMIKFANWFIQDSKIQLLPILPHIHQGTYEKIRFYHYDKKLNQLVIIRLWKSSYQLRQDDISTALWFGDISYMESKRNMSLQYLVTKKDLPVNLPEVMRKIKGIKITEKKVADLVNQKNITLFLLY